MHCLTNHLLWLKFPSVLPFFRPLGVGLSFGRRLLLPILASGCLTLCLLIPADMYHVPKHRAIYAGLPSPQLLPVVLLHVTLHPTAGGPAAHTNCAAPASECPQAVIEMVSASPGWSSHQGCCGALIRIVRQSTHDSSCSPQLTQSRWLGDAFYRLNAIGFPLLILLLPCRLCTAVQLPLGRPAVAAAYIPHLCALYSALPGLFTFGHLASR